MESDCSPPKGGDTMSECHYMEGAWGKTASSGDNGKQRYSLLSSNSMRLIGMKMENLKLAAASILGLVLVVMPMIIGNHISQFGWGFCFSAIELLTIVIFYECGYYDGTLDKRSIGYEASSKTLGNTRYKDKLILLIPCVRRKGIMK